MKQLQTIIMGGIFTVGVVMPWVIGVAVIARAAFHLLMGAAR